MCALFEFFELFTHQKSGEPGAVRTGPASASKSVRGLTAPGSPSPYFSGATSLIPSTSLTSSNTQVPTWPTLLSSADTDAGSVCHGAGSGLLRRDFFELFEFFELFTHQKSGEPDAVRPRTGIGGEIGPGPYAPDSPSRYFSEATSLIPSNSLNSSNSSICLKSTLEELSLSDRFGIIVLPNWNPLACNDLLVPRIHMTDHGLKELSTHAPLFSRRRRTMCALERSRSSTHPPPRFTEPQSHSTATDSNPRSVPIMSAQSPFFPTFRLDSSPRNPLQHSAGCHPQPKSHFGSDFRFTTETRRTRSHSFPLCALRVSVVNPNRSLCLIRKSQAGNEFGRAIFEIFACRKEVESL